MWHVYVHTASHCLYDDSKMGETTCVAAPLAPWPHAGLWSHMFPTPGGQTSTCYFPRGLLVVLFSSGSAYSLDLLHT